jgi:hypothetical protein
VFHMPRQLRSPARLVLFAVALAACSSSAKTTVAPTSTTVAAPAPTTEAPTTSAAPVAVPFTVTPTVDAANVISAMGTGKLDSTVATAITTALGQYVAAATFAALQGKSVVLDPVFTADALARLSADGRAAVADEGAAVVTASPTADLHTSLRGVLGPDGKVGVVVATIDLHVGGTAADGTAVSIHRSGDLTMIDDGGTWKIDSFQLKVERGA